MFALQETDRATLEAMHNIVITMATTVAPINNKNNNVTPHGQKET